MNLEFHLGDSLPPNTEAKSISVLPPGKIPWVKNRLSLIYKKNKWGQYHLAYLLDIKIFSTLKWTQLMQIA